jgi:hypothetical protein
MERSHIQLVPLANVRELFFAVLEMAAIALQMLFSLLRRHDG